MNTVIISGRLGADPETRTTAGGKTVCGFRMALDSYKRDAPAEWIGVSCWDKTAEFVQHYLAKGRKVLVEGRLQVREWEKDGQKRSTVDVVANRVEFMDSNPEGRGAQAGGGAPSQRQAPAQAGGQRQADDPGYFDDDVPF